MRPILLVVPREAEGTRLDRFLASTLSAMEGGPSRTELQRWIEHGSVKVDGAARKASDKLREGARITVEPEPPPKTEALADAGVEFDVVYMDDAVIVLDKPAGLVVHPARGHQTGTLVNGLLARGVFEPPDGDEELDERPSVSARGDDAASGDDAQAFPGGARDLDRSRPGIVHRLDKGTSGLMVVARHPRAREHLKEQFAAHSIEREYVALCVGEVKAKTFDTLHGRHPTDRVRFSSKVKTGKRAVTHVRPLEGFGRHATYVACRLETGRTHQIRVHLADDRTPILGDPLYGKVPKHEVLREAALALGRPALHARVLGFVHPMTGEAIRFEVDPPADFQLALTTLRAMP
ncbi:MAG: RluA family pseudouridine synthase [Labilithrix sp.]|nr:RluA family pseudouridine synthase [Labilithrix sp.]MCW5831626.1 RluA family pseudouridine synthase [Labilithrix sp.]